VRGEREEMISNIEKTGPFVSFSGKFTGMRVPQSFTVSTNESGKILIQSDTRIGYIHIVEKAVKLTKPIKGGAYFVHLRQANISSSITDEEIAMIKSVL
jgi:hypothetical protein